MNIFQPSKNAAVQPTMKVTHEIRRAINEVDDDSDVEIIGGTSYVGSSSWNFPRRVVVMQKRPKNNGLGFLC